MNIIKSLESWLAYSYQKNLGQRENSNPTALVGIPYTVYTKWRRSLV